MSRRKSPSIPLPRGWPRAAKSGLLHAIALARAALVWIRSGLENSPLERARLVAENAALRAYAAQLREELRIKDARMERIAARNRPHYPPEERLAILALRAAVGWTVAETARRFQLTAQTIAGWMKRLDEDGPAALVRTPVPVNRFPDFVGELVRRLRGTLPAMGKVRIAQISGASGVASRAGHGTANAAAQARTATGAGAE